MTTFTVEQIKKINELATGLVKAGQAKNMAQGIEQSKNMLISDGRYNKTGKEMGIEVSRIMEELKFKTGAEAPVPDPATIGMIAQTDTEETPSRENPPANGQQEESVPLADQPISEEEIAQSDEETIISELKDEYDQEADSFLDTSEIDEIIAGQQDDYAKPEQEEQQESLQETTEQQEEPEEQQESAQETTEQQEEPDEVSELFREERTDHPDSQEDPAADMYDGTEDMGDETEDMPDSTPDSILPDNKPEEDFPREERQEQTIPNSQDIEENDIEIKAEKESTLPQEPYQTENIPQEETEETTNTQEEPITPPSPEEETDIPPQEETEETNTPSEQPTKPTEETLPPGVSEENTDPDKEEDPDQIDDPSYDISKELKTVEELFKDEEKFITDD